MAEIRWTSEAQNRLQQIHDYISTDNPDAAYSVTCGIYDKIQILSDYPEIGHIYRRDPEGDIRILLYGHYKIAYLYLKDDIIDVLGVAHGSMPIEHWLKIAISNK